jgi:MFS family permease
LVFALIRGNPDAWSSTKVVAAFIAGGVLPALFVVIERVRREPMLDLRLLRRPAVVGASLAAIALSASLFSMRLYITLYLQDILGYSPFQAGPRLLPLTLAVLLVAPLAGRLSERLPIRLLLGLGLTLVAAGLALMTLVQPSSGWTVLLAGFIVAGAGSGLSNPPLASAAIGTVREERAGVGSGINNTARQVGVAAGIAALGAIFQSRVQSALSDQLAHAAPQLGARREAIVDHATSGDPAQALRALPPELREAVAHAIRVAFVSGVDRILWIAAAIGLAGAVLTLVLVRGRDFLGATDEPAIPTPQRGALRQAA